MKITIKSPKQIETIREGGKNLSEIFKQALKIVKEGVQLHEIEDFVSEKIDEIGGKPAFAQVPGYDWATCINVNEGVVHGIPDQYQIKKGDVISLDIGLFYKGWNTDMSETFQVNKGASIPVNPQNSEKVEPEKVRIFLETGKRALQASIDQSRPYNRFGHISQAMQKVIEAEDFAPLRNLTGHGIGRKLHEPPLIPCFLEGDVEATPMIKPGMVFAVEVIYAMGDYQTETDKKNNWTIRMKDGKIAAIFEKTIAISDDGPLICT